MARTVTFGSVQTESIRNQNVSGINLYANLIHGTLNTAFAAGAIDFSKINLKVTLRRDRKEYTLISDNLRTLGAESNFFNPIFLGALNFLNGGFKTLITQSASTFHNISIPMYVDFGGIINLDGDDEIYVELNAPNGAVNSTVNLTSSYIYFDVKEDIGVEVGIPFIKSYTLQQGQANQAQSLGDNVFRVTLLNFNQTSYLQSAQVVVNANLSSDKFNSNADYSELISIQASQFPNATDAAARLQNWRIYTGPTDLDGAKLDLQLNGSNVSTSENVIVWRSFETNPKLLAKAVRMSAKHEKRNAEKYGF